MVLIWHHAVYQVLDSRLVAQEELLHTLLTLDSDAFLPDELLAIRSLELYEALVLR